MIRPFRILTDVHLSVAIVKALRDSGWDVVRAVDVFPQDTLDETLLDYGVKDDRVFATNDKRLLPVAYRWISEGRALRGLVYWPQEETQRLSPGVIVEAFNELASRPNPFAYPIEFLKP